MSSENKGNLPHKSIRHTSLWETEESQQHSDYTLQAVRLNFSNWKDLWEDVECPFLAMQHFVGYQHLVPDALFLVVVSVFMS